MRHLIKIALFLLAAVAAYYVYGFTSLVASPLFAFGAAGSLVGTYIGLAFAEIPHGQRLSAQRVAVGAMVIEALYGVLYVLSVQSPEVFAAPLSLWLSIPLAILHGAAFSILAFFVSIFVVHERGVTTELSPAEQRDQAIVIALDRLVEKLDRPMLPSSEPLQLTDEQETKADLIRRLASMQVEHGGDLAAIDTTAIADATGFSQSYVQQVVSRWRSKQ